MRDLSTFDIIDLRRFSEDECNQHTESETLSHKNIPQIRFWTEPWRKCTIFPDGRCARVYRKTVPQTRFCLLPEAHTVSQEHFQDWVNISSMWHPTSNQSKFLNNIVLWNDVQRKTDLVRGMFIESFVFVKYHEDCKSLTFQKWNAIRSCRQQKVKN